MAIVVDDLGEGHNTAGPPYARPWDWYPQSRLEKFATIFPPGLPMPLTGKQFRLVTATFVMQSQEGKRTAVTVPAGAIIRVVCGPRPNDRFVDVLWEGRIGQ